MPKEEWYRQRAWTPETERAFEEKLSRSRGQRSEYLRIQAYTLVETDDLDNAHAAVELAGRYLAENPEGLFRGSVFKTLARAWTTLDHIDMALSAYREALEAERGQKNLHEYGYIEFAWFVAVRRLCEAYEEALSAMGTDRRDEDLQFPLNRYRYFVALALISSELGDAPHAGRMALNAMAAAAEPRGPFVEHLELGTVTGVGEGAYERLTELAG